MQSSLLKQWGIQSLNSFDKLNSSQSNEWEKQSIIFSQKKSIIKLPLQFTYPPVEILSKELTKLNSKYKQRIIYLGPRWNDSFQWHRKFSNPNNFHSEFFDAKCTSGYHFEQKRIQRNNNFIHDSMNKQNRFFKNQVYYRAFQGMNPTLGDQAELIFESRFQSGNLDCVVKVNENQFDLFLRIDTNTRGNLFWYFFKVKLPRNGKIQSKKVKLNICNITKSKTLYERNLKPYVKRTKINESNEEPFKTWAQGSGIHNCKIRQKKLRYQFIYEKIKLNILYELSFELQLNESQEVSLAYCIPYTYSNLMQQLMTLHSQIQNQNISNVFIKKLGESLTGVQIPMVIIGDIRDVENLEEKKVVFITGRTHPGQSNSSFIVSSLINQLCLKKVEIFQNRTIFIIIPMLNPDGVILGNGRSSAFGRDLNRQFKSWNAFLNPQVVAIKKFIEKIQEYYEIQMYFDFHGHSKKKNIFFFGPNYSLTEPNYYRCRVFPKILSKNLDSFRYFGCSYSISLDKRSTARAIMLYEFKIPFFYTVETSIGFYHDYLKREDVPFNKNSLSKIGVKFKESLKQYFEGIEQFQAFSKSKRKQKIPKPEINVLFKIQNQKVNQKQTSIRYPNQDQNNLKLMKMFQQIKIQTKNLDKTNNQVKSDTDSDSCRASQEFQVQKVKEFSQMLLKFNRLERKKMQSHEISFQIDKEGQKIKNKKKSKHHSEMQETMFSFIRKLATQTSHDHRFNSRKNKLDSSKPMSKQFHSFSKQMCEDEKFLLLNNEIKINSNSPTKKSEPLNISAHNFFRKNVEFEIQANENIGFVNFSNVIQNPRSGRYSQEGKQYKISTRSQRRSVINANLLDQKERTNKNLGKYFFPFSEQKEVPYLDEFQSGIKISTGLGTSKPYPASFYRIKYQSSHKKYRYKTPDPSMEVTKGKDERNLKQDKSDKKPKKNEIIKQPHKLFINISKLTT